MHKRQKFINQITQTFKIHPICCLLGPRQCGKTTLAKMFTQDATFFDLEDPFDLIKFDNSKLLLEDLSGTIVIDEIQRAPNLFPYLRVLADRYPDRKYLILGSASRDLIQQSSETLAGRIGYIEVTPFQLQEIPDSQTLLWKRGGFPKSYLAETDELSFKWRLDYIQTFLEQDIPNLGISIPPAELRRFWAMLAHYHGGILNYSELGRSLGYSDHTIKRYLSILEGTFMVRQLQPWFANIKKRQIKAPKIYLRDSGILHALLKEQDITSHPKLGASWEGFAIEEILRTRLPIEAFFWSSTTAETDLLIRHGQTFEAFECKYTQEPKLTKGMLEVIETFDLDMLTIVVPLSANFRIHEKVCVMGLKEVLLENIHR